MATATITTGATTIIIITTGTVTMMAIMVMVTITTATMITGELMRQYRRPSASGVHGAT
jgi:hypothetical protein